MISDPHYKIAVELHRGWGVSLWGYLLFLSELVTSRKYEQKYHN